MTKLARLSLAALAVACLAAPAALAQTRSVSPLVSGDETIVVTQHRVQTTAGPLDYEARIGRLPIRNDETGEVRGYVGFIAYVAKSRGQPRPLTFLWNGGPTTPSVLVHTEVFGPRRWTHEGMVDNAETLLAASDLVFFDPVGTGFGRPAKPEFAEEFYSTLGDFAATAEFVRAYRARFGAEDQPLFLAGESYGTWRVNGATELLTKAGIPVKGAILISGGVPGSLMPPQFQDAMYIQARTAAAFELNKLPPDLMADKAVTVKAADAWASGVYLPALERLATLTPAEREKIAGELARFTGVKASQVDRKTLVMNNRAYLSGLYEGDAKKVLNTYDMRIVGAEHDDPTRPATIAGYFRNELGYATDLAYTGLEDGYMPLPGPKRRSTGERWNYNHVELTPEVMARMNGGGGPPLSQPWLQNAMRLDPGIRVYVAAGRYDSLNMCEGNKRMSAKLEPALASRFTHVCYEGGHMMYRDQPTRLQLARDLTQFIEQAAAGR